MKFRLGSYVRHTPSGLTGTLGAFHGDFSKDDAIVGVIEGVRPEEITSESKPDYNWFLKNELQLLAE